MRSNPLPYPDLGKQRIGQPEGAGGALSVRPADEETTMGAQSTSRATDDDLVEPENLTPLLPAGSVLGELVTPMTPFAVDWDRLAGQDGWSVWLGHPPVPESIDVLPANPDLVWGAPEEVIGTAVATALHYAALRGADSFVSAAGVLRREGPVSLIVPGDLSPTIAASLAECSALGLPVVSGTADLAGDLAALRQRRIRRGAHGVALGRPHDPVLARQTITPAGSFGGNSLSSFVLHNEGERDQVQVTGTPSERIGIEIGVRGEGIDLAASELIEDDAARMPGFLDGLTSARSGNTVTIAWGTGGPPDPEALGLLWQTWLRAIWDATLVDVRIAFAPDHGRSALLVDMRTRSSQYHAYRGEALAAERTTST